MIEECLAVEFRVTGDGCPLADASETVGTTVDARPPQLRADGNALLRFSAPAGDELVSALDDDDRVRYLHVAAVEDRYNYRCLVKEPCVVHRLTDVGFLVDSLRYYRGTEHHVGAVVGHEVLESVLEAAGETVGVSLKRVHPLEDETTVAQQWDLTPAQEEALRVSFEMGYFTVPREVTAAEVAEELGVSKSAVLERLRRGLAALLQQVL